MFAGFALAMLLLPGNPDPAPPVPAGTPIVSITVVRYDVFDTSLRATSSWPYRWANTLHVMTRERFIRNLLLFKVGDPLNYAILAESERILRDRGFLNPVDIAVRLAPGGAEVLVETHDQWTTEAGVSYGLLGNQQRSGARAEEDNLLGLGKQAYFDVDSTPERTKTTFRYKDPLVLGTRWQMELAYSNATDGSGEVAILDYPFFSLATPQAGGTEWRREELREWLWSEGKKTVSGILEHRQLQLWGGLRLPGDGVVTNRLTVGAFMEKARYGSWEWEDGSPYLKPEDRDLAGPQIGWEHDTDSWQVVRGFRGWQRQEDVPLGPNWSLSAGFSQPTFGGDRRRTVVSSSFQAGTLDAAQYSWLLATFNGRFEAAGLANAITHLELGTALTGPAGWRARLSIDHGYNLDRDQQLTLGADTGLRGWNPGYFDGSSRAVLNVEWRRCLTGEVLHLGILGVDVFSDTGRTWAPSVGPGSARWHLDAGVGLLIELTRAAVVRVIRLEVAKPDDGRGPIFLATGTSLF